MNIHIKMMAIFILIKFTLQIWKPLSTNDWGWGGGDVKKKLKIKLLCLYLRGIKVNKVIIEKNKTINTIYQWDSVG